MRFLSFIKYKFENRETIWLKILRFKKSPDTKSKYILIQSITIIKIIFTLFIALTTIPYVPLENKNKQTLIIKNFFALDKIRFVKISQKFQFKRNN